MSPTSYDRPLREYQRPGQRLVLPAIPAEHIFETFPRGTVFNHAENLPRGRTTLELVPEPGNPYDSRALALDYRNSRIGYVKATLAAPLQPRVIRLNREGYSVWVQALVGKPQGREDAGLYEGELGELDRAYALVPQVTIFLPRVDSPHWGDQPHLQLLEIRTLWSALDESVRADVRAGNFHLNATAARAFWEHRHLAPHLNWPARHLEADDLPSELPSLLRELRLEHGAAMAHERAQKRRELERTQAQRRAKKDAEVKRLHEQIIEMAKGGQSYASIGRELGLSADTISSHVRRAGGRRTSSPTEDRERRWNRALEAVKMQESGLSRKELAEYFGVADAVMKVILRDGRFFRHPERNLERLARAQQALAEGWSTKDPVAARARSAKDARVLQQHRPDLMQ